MATLIKNGTVVNGTGSQRADVLIEGARMSSERRFCIGFLLSIALGVRCGAQEPSLRVLLLDAKSGHPLIRQHLLVFYGDSPKQAKTETKSTEATTDLNGLATLSIPIAQAKFALVFVDWHRICIEHPNQESIDISTVVPSGLVINYCTKRSFPVKPGVLTIAAREESLFEKCLTRFRSEEPWQR